MLATLRVCSLIVFTAVCGLQALGQGVPIQGGPWTPGHVPQYVGQGGSQPVIMDGGSAGGGGTGANAGELGIAARGTGTAPYAGQGTGPYGTNICDYDGPTSNPTGYHYLCFSANAQGGGLIAYGSGGVASQLPLSFNLNGTTYQFPFTSSGAVGPSTTTVGDLAVWNNTTGTLLKDVAQVTLAQLPSIAGSTLLCNATGSTATPTACASLPISIQTGITELGTITVGLWNGTAIANANLAAMAAGTTKCNVTGSTAAPQDCTGAQAESILEFTQSGTNAVQQTVDSRLNDWISVKAWGALGNSNGTTGNGHDDTVAIQAALNNATNADVYFPCGTYRITSGIAASGGGPYHLHGNGYCTQIFNDSAAAAISFNFGPVGFCSSNQTPCIIVEGLNFIPPTSTGTGNAAIQSSNEQNIIVRNNYVRGYRAGFVLTTSFAPLIDGNHLTQILGVAIYTQTDATINGAKIVNNTIFSSGISLSSCAVVINGPGNGGIVIQGNDIESNYCGVQFTGVSGVNLYGNYIEGQTTSNVLFSGSNLAFDVAGNHFGFAASGDLWNNLTGARFAYNDISGLAVTFGSNALGINLGFNQLTSASIGALPTPTITSCGTSPSVIGTRQAGQVSTGTGGPSGCTITFELAYSNTPFCTVTQQGSLAVFAYAVSTTGISVASTSASSQKFNWTCGGA